MRPRGAPDPAAPARQKLVVRTDWRPHSEAQASIVRAGEREIDVTCGRRFGKTIILLAWLTGLHEGATWGAVHVPGGRFWYCAPTLRPCRDFYRDLKRILHGLVTRTNDTELSLRLFNETLVECKSLEIADNLRGAGLDGIGLDEKGTVSEAAWTEVLRPMLSDPPERCIRRAMRCGTPRGKKHWTYREHLGGLAGPRGPNGRVAFQFPTVARPGMAEEVERAKATIPHNVFLQEYAAEYLDNAAGYFLRLEDAYDGQPVPAGPQKDERYVLGFDLAHADDWSVIAVVRCRPKPWRLVAVERFCRADFETTRLRVTETCKRWSADALCDATAGGFTGDVGVEAFRAGGWSRIYGFDARSSGGANREDLLANLAIAIEQGQCKMPGTAQAPGFPIVAMELDGFQVQMLPSGRARAQAGPGLDDDCVMALALACWQAKAGGATYGAWQHY